MCTSLIYFYFKDLFESPDNFALVRLQLTQSLYCKLLTLIIIDEERKQKLSTNKQISIQVSTGLCDSHMTTCDYNVNMLYSGKFWRELNLVNLAF